ncbi:IclR family transcriptional regulator (plasmid) [Rhodococcus pseudokoreensis]|uniref:IclR family transcriptional regulator n=1 Tax=Rhodococcus pseudokoreensis TaxID=2811421 RepID=A0A974VYM0_9NOCA|nr:IclR family transcriptional regulator [Rhodococcus pseudokoreensis]QSE88005.1 IclR family transcriptional regulator [Rhodococcus pseudokoreensis]
MTAETGANAGGGVQSVERVFDILEMMASARGPIGVTELADLAALPLPTIHRLVRTLVNRGYVRQVPSRRYALGPKLVRLGDSATQLIGSWSGPHLSSLVQQSGETANMAVLDGNMAVYVAQVPSPHSMRMFTEVGRRVFLHCTGVGKALLLQLSNEAVRSLVTRTGMPSYTENSLTDPETLIADLEVSRRRGYALDEGEQEIGVRCFAVPVPNAPTPTAVSISGPATRVTVESADQIGPLLQRVAQELATEFEKDAAL